MIGDGEYMYWNPITGKKHNDSMAGDLTILNDGMNHIMLPERKMWYPCYDWCGRYTGSVFCGVFEDAENIRKRME